MSNRIIIMSGIPGSGKSTIARKYKGKASNRHCVVVSADAYFTAEDGTYDFNLGELPNAHQFCFRQFLHFVKFRCSLIIVDNTNLSAYEISPYYLAGEAFGNEVEIRRVPCSQEVAFARQTHGVPQDTHLKMATRFIMRDVMPWWNVSGISQ